jgi:hypothetical protein
MQKTQKRAPSRRRQSPPPLPTLTTITQRDQPTPERAGTGEPPSPHHHRPFTPSPSPTPARGVPGCHAASARLPRPSTPAKSQLSSPGTTRDPPSAITAAHHSSPAPDTHSVPNLCSTCVACVASLSLSIVPRPSRVSGPRPALVRGGGDANTVHPIHPVPPITQSTPSPNHPINPITQSPNRPQPRRGHLGLTSLLQRALVYCELRRPLSFHPASMPS